MEESSWSVKRGTFKISGSLPRGRPKKTWNKVIKSDLKERKVIREVAEDRIA